MKNFIIVVLILVVVWFLTRSWLLNKAAAVKAELPAVNPGSTAANGPTAASGWPIMPANGIAPGPNAIQAGVTAAGAPVYVNTVVSTTTVPQSVEPTLADSFANLRFTVAPGITV